jgi:hypothetical protein
MIRNATLRNFKAQAFCPRSNDIHDISPKPIAKDEKEANK